MEDTKEIMGCSSSKYTINEEEIKSIPLFTFKGLSVQAYVCDVYDGDTFTCIFTFDGRKQKFKIRMYGYDAPEMKPSRSIPTKKRDIIIERAISAQNFLAEKIQGKWIHLECQEFDKYGRILGVVKLNKNDKQSINDIMIAKEFGTVYFGGKKEEFDSI